MTLVMENTANALHLGFAHHKAGNLRAAEQAYRQVLAADPRNSAAIHLLAVLATQVGKFELAVQHATTAIQLDGVNPTYHATLAEALRGVGQLDRAITSYRQALRLKPDFVEVLTNLGTLLQTKGNLQAAADCYFAAIRAQPRYVDPHFNLAVVRHVEGNWAAADRHYADALALAPGHAQAQVGRGQVLREQGKQAESAACFELALQSDPASQLARCGMGMAYQEQDKLEEAIVEYRRAIQIAPQMPDAHYNLATVLRKQGKLPEALACFQEAVRLLPSFLEAQIGLAAVYNRLGLHDEATGPSRRALELNPQSSLGFVHLAAALQGQGDMQGSVAALRRSLELDPTYTVEHCNLVYALNFHPGHDAGAVLAEHLAWADRHAEPLTAAAAPHAIDRQPERRLRIGYVSSHFREHAVSFFSEPMIAAHDHEHFEIFCYADESTSDAVTERFRQAADQWRAVTRLSDEATAEQIRKDKIDILVDLAGHIGGNKLLVFARKPAPIQVTYLGYQNTTGMSAMDYRLTDAHADPPGTTDRYYTEKLVRLPRSFFCYSPPAAPPVNPLPARSAGCVTFGSFNHVQKITPEAIEVWAKILAAVPNSRLHVLAYSGGQFERHVRRIMTEAGIDPGRVDVLDKRPRYEYLRLFHQIDLALDTFPFNGHTTVCDALWMGVPSIMLEGGSYASRFGGSVPLNVGLEELIAHDCQEYLEIAAKLAANLDRLEEIRATSRASMENSPLMDAAGFTRNLEQAFRQMWREKCDRG